MSSVLAEECLAVWRALLPHTMPLGTFNVPLPVVAAGAGLSAERAEVVLEALRRLGVLAPRFGARGVPYIFNLARCPAWSEAAGGFPFDVPALPVVAKALARR